MRCRGALTTAHPKATGAARQSCGAVVNWSRGALAAGFGAANAARAPRPHVSALPCGQAPVRSYNNFFPSDWAGGFTPSSFASVGAISSTPTDSLRTTPFGTPTPNQICGTCWS